MTIEVRYFAILAQQAGTGMERTASNGSLTALYDDCARRHGFALSRAHVRPAVNDEFVPWEQPLQDGDVVVFIPPVSGG